MPAPITNRSRTNPTRGVPSGLAPDLRPRGSAAAIVLVAALVGVPASGWGVTPRLSAAEPDGYRRLAPGVLTVVPADVSDDENVLRDDLYEITEGLKSLSWQPRQAAANTTLVARGRNREFPRDIWCLEFAFKPPRLIEVDVPVSERAMRRKTICYLVYRVRNVGGRRTVIDPAEPSNRRTERFEKPVRFLPHFVLESREPLSEAEGVLASREYLDRLVPTAMEQIRRREDPRRRFLDSAEMAGEEIGPGEERWGVATWEDVDPRIDFFTIYIRGLTNAIRWRKREGITVQPGDDPGTGLEQTLESLRIDFWRQGDERSLRDDEISVGYAGLFETMMLGDRLLEATGRSGLSRSSPTAGLARVGVAWSDLLEPDAGAGISSLLPLETVLRRIAAVPDPVKRGVAAREIFGEAGIGYVEELARAMAGPVDPAREAARRAALAGVKFTPETAADQPIEALAAIVRALEAAPSVAERQRLAQDFFGPAGNKVRRLAREVAADRTLATLWAIDADTKAIAASNARAAFEAVRPAVDVEKDPDQRLKVLQGLFGPRGPDFYALATRYHPGVEHAWVFRFEEEGDGGL